MDRHNARKMLSNYYPLVAIIIGVILVSFPMGPYETLDTELEFNTTRGVLRWGYPYLDRFGEPHIDSYGDLFNMPPLGFYTQAAVFLIFGQALENGIALVTLFGLASAVTVYLLGKELYGKATGLLAATLFALTPWQLILTRAFLIDAQCLCLSLVYLYIGILAVRKGSVKLAAISGVFFAAAFLTKQYAVFMLIPLLLLYIYHRPKNLKMLFSQLSAFSLPVIFSSLLWYQVILGKELLYLVNHNDFRDLNFPGVVPSYSFVFNFLVEYGLGIFFVSTAVFSFIIGFWFWKQLPKQSVVSDLVCLVTILSILGLVMYLAVNLNLKAPYTSAVKYIYQALPFFSLAAASLATKSLTLLKSSKQSPKVWRILLLGISIIGIVLLVTPIVANIYTTRQLTTASFLIFRVEPNQDIGYSFHITEPLSQNDPLLSLQFIGFMIVISGILWASKHFIAEHIRPLWHYIREKPENVE